MAPPVSTYLSGEVVQTSVATSWCEYWVGQFRSDNEKRSRKTTLFYTPWKMRSATLVEHITIKDKSRKAAIYVAAVVVTPRFNSLYQFASM